MNETEKDLQIREIDEKDRRIKELEERVQKIEGRLKTVPPSVPAATGSPYPQNSPYTTPPYSTRPASTSTLPVRPETNYGAIGLVLEFFGLFFFGIVFSTFGLLLGLGGALTKTKKTTGFAASCVGLLEMVVYVILLKSF